MMAETGSSSITGTNYRMDKRLRNVIKKALEKKKEEWQSSEEFKKALEVV